VRAFQEAESYPGPSLIIAYSHCIAHGYDLRWAASSRSWLWTRARGRSIGSTRAVSRSVRLRSSSTLPRRKVELSKYIRNETRFRMVEQANPERFKHLLALAQREVTNRFAVYEQLAKVTMPVKSADEQPVAEKES